MINARAWSQRGVSGF